MEEGLVCPISIENPPVELVVVVRVAGLDILLATVEDRFGGEKLGKDASNCPNVNGFSVMTCAKQKLRSAIPAREKNG